MSGQKLIAVHAIQLIVSGELTVIKPTYPLVLEDEKQISQLVALGAVRKPQESEMRLFKESTVKASGDQSQNPAAGTVTGKELAKLKKEELVALAGKEGIEIDPTATNSSIVKSIEDARKAKEDADTDPDTNGLV